jgi:acetoin utilization deacetylase AcuC-like enzyme
MTPSPLQYAIRKGLAQRVLILDWDVHHGNGTQELFYSRPDVLYISIHRRDGGCFYPTGEPNDVTDSGKGAGLGHSINIPFDGPYGDGEMLSAMHRIVLPVARDYDPQLILVSCGFDAAVDDPLGDGCAVSAGCYAQMLWHLMGIGGAGCKVLLALEGGYNLESLADCAEAVVRAMTASVYNFIDAGSGGTKGQPRVSDSAWAVLRRVSAHQERYWECLKGIHKGPTTGPP